MAKTSIFFIYALSVFFMSVCKSSEIFVGYISALEIAVGGDKNLHFVLAMPLAFFALLAAEQWFNFSAWLRNSLVIVVLLLMLLAEEFSQFWLSSRHLDLNDTLYGFSGIFVGSNIYFFWLIGKYQITYQLTKK